MRIMKIMRIALALLAIMFCGLFWYHTVYHVTDDSTLNAHLFLMQEGEVLPLNQIWPDATRICLLNPHYGYPYDLAAEQQYLYRMTGVENLTFPLGSRDSDSGISHLLVIEETALKKMVRLESGWHLAQYHWFSNMCSQPADMVIVARENGFKTVFSDHPEVYPEGIMR